MHVKNKWLFIATIMLILFACRHQIANPGGGDNNNGNGGDSSGNGGHNDSTICFEEQILPLFQTNCAKSGCHDAKSHKEGYVFDSYNNIISRGITPGNSKGSNIYQIISGQKGNSDDKDEDIMPPPPNTPLSQDQVNLIAKWIDEGALNTTNCSSECDTSSYTYSGTIRPILNIHCTGCHNNTTQNGGVNLVTYTGVQSVALNGKLSGTINFQVGYPPMPQGGQQLNDCNISQIMKWINSGAPNN